MAKFQTQLVHGPVDTNDPYGAVVLPIYPATTYASPAIGTAPQYDYGRSGNPTRHAVEAQLAALEGAKRPLPRGWRRFMRRWRFFRLAIIWWLASKSMEGPFACLRNFLPGGI